MNDKTSTRVYHRYYSYYRIIRHIGIAIFLCREIYDISQRGDFIKRPKVIGLYFVYL